MRWAFFSGRKSTDEVIKDKKPCGHTVFRKRIDLFNNPTSEYANAMGSAFAFAIQEGYRTSLMNSTTKKM